MNPKSNHSTSNAGIVLLIVLGILGLMSVLAVTFVSMARLERAIATHYVSSVRSKMAAESGVEKAVAELRSLVGPPSKEFQQRMAFGAGEVPGVSLEDVLVPSFATMNVDVDGDGIPDAVSGVVGSSGRTNGDYYKLRVEDESGKFNLNNSPGLFFQDRMYNVIENLMTNLFDGDSRLPLLATDVAVALETARGVMGGRFSTMEQVRDSLLLPVATGVLTPFDWEILRPNLTIHSWVDPNTLKPAPPFNRPTGEPTIIESVFDQTGALADSDFNYAPADPGTMHDKYDDDIYTMEQFQVRSMELEPRSPVHINVASEELISALLQGIQGYYIFDYGYLYEESYIYDYPFGPIHPKNGVELGEWHTLNNSQRHDTRSVSESDGYGFYTAILLWMARIFDYPWGVVGDPIILPYLRNYRPLVYDKSQFDDATYTLGRTGEVMPRERTNVWPGGAIPLNTSTPIPLTSLIYTKLAGGGLGSLKKTIPVSKALADDLAALLYDRIHTAGGADANMNGTTLDRFEQEGPFRTWAEFQGFIRAYFQYDSLQARMPEPGGTHPHVPDFALQSVADAILANFNPNSNLIDYNPGKLLHKLVDKGHLVNDPPHPDPDIPIPGYTPTQGYTTEFCFEPTGVYAIDCLGRILVPDGTIASETKLETIIEVWTPYRMTSQAQFLGAESRNQVVNVDDFDTFFNPNLGPNASAGTGAGTLGAEGDPNGFTTQVYPEAIVVDTSSGAPVLDADRLSGAIYDGYIMPSTLQDMDHVGHDLTFRASFNGSLDAAEESKFDNKIYTEDPSVAGFPTRIKAQHPSNSRLMIPAQDQHIAMVSAGETAPVLASGTLFSDGGYSQIEQELVYASGPVTLQGAMLNGVEVPAAGTFDDGNFGSDFGMRGILMMWVKPNWLPERTGRQHTFFDISYHDIWPGGGWEWYRPNGLYLHTMKPLIPAGPLLFNFRDTPQELDFKIFLHPSRNASDDYFAPDPIIDMNNAGIPIGSQLNPYVALFEEDHMPVKLWPPNLDPDVFPTDSLHNNLEETMPFQSMRFSMSSYMGDAVSDTAFPDNWFGQPVVPPSYQFLINSNYLFTETASHRHEAAAHAGQKYNMEGRRWNFIGASWDMHHAERMTMRINGDVPDNDIVQNLVGGRRAAKTYVSTPVLASDFGWMEDLSIPAKWHVNAWRQKSPQLQENYRYNQYAEDSLFGTPSVTGLFGNQKVDTDYFKVLTYENPMRFGSWSRGNTNFVADSTFDEIRIYSNKGGGVTDAFLQTAYEKGRFYNFDAAPATYISPEIDVSKVLKTPGFKATILHHISWTAYWPDDALDGIPAASLVANPHSLPEWELDPLRKSWTPITVDIAINGAWEYSNADDDLQPGNTPIHNPAGNRVLKEDGSPVLLSVGDTVQYKFYFNEILDDATPMHEAPVLDDVTLYFASLAPKVIVWNQIH